MQQSRLHLFKRIFDSALGLFIFSIGVYLTIQANIGLAPWDCLSMAISARIGYSYGVVHTTISFLILIVDILMKEKIGYGTLLDAMLVGNYVDFIARFGLLDVSESLPFSILLVVIGLFIMGYGVYFYMKAGLSCGPRDSLLIALGKRFPRTPIGVVQTGMVAVVLLIGWLLGGPVGIGTILSVFGLGTALQIVCKLFRFEPRDVVHQNLIETTKLLFSR